LEVCATVLSLAESLVSSAHVKLVAAAVITCNARYISIVAHAGGVAAGIALRVDLRGSSELEKLGFLFLLGRNLVEVASESGAKESGSHAILSLSSVQFFHASSGFFFGLKLDNSAERLAHVWHLSGVVSEIAWNWLAFEKDADERNGAELGEHGGNGTDGTESLWHFDAENVGDGSCLEDVLRKSVDSSDLGVFFVELEFLGLFQAVSSNSPVLGQLLDIFQSSEELDGEEALALLADLSKEIVVLGQVLVREVELGGFNDSSLGFVVGKDHLTFIRSEFRRLGGLLGAGAARTDGFVLVSKELLRALAPETESFSSDVLVLHGLSLELLVKSLLLLDQHGDS